MNKTFLLVFVAFLAISAMVSASVQCSNTATVVKGTIYQDLITNPIANAQVQVSCNNVIKNTTSAADGTYAVSYTTLQCQYQDAVYVQAVKNDLTGSEEGTISLDNIPAGPCVTLDVGVVNVPLIPEFGLMIGGLTAISAIAVFFMVRRA